MKLKNLIKPIRLIPILLAAAVLAAGCGKDDAVTFSAEIQEVSENRILVETISHSGFDKAWVDLHEAKYDFDPSPGQVVEITIRPEIRESDPVQVTALKLVYKGEAQRKVSDYFPIRENTKYVYEGKGNEFAGFDVYTEFTSEDRVQQRIENGGSVIARVFRVKDGELARVLTKGETYYRENLLNQKENEKEVLLREPLEKGNSWSLEDGSERTITGLSTEVKTPIGEFTAIEVVTEGSNGTSVDYYVRDIGLVKTIFRTEGLEISSTLKSIEEDQERAERIRFYYPDMKTGEIAYEESEVVWHTNDETAKVLEEAYKGTVNETFGTVFSTGTAIRSLSRDEENRVRLDLNRAFVSEMNFGAAYEALILQCAAATFGNYYNSDQVILTIEGKPYESGHIKMKEGESIPVRLEGIEEEKTD